MLVGDATLSPQKCRLTWSDGYCGAEYDSFHYPEAVDPAGQPYDLSDTIVGAPRLVIVGKLISN